MACRTARPKRDLVRIVRAPDGRITVDPTGRLAGRGAYLCADAGCWTNEKTTRSLERALETRLPPGLLESFGSRRTDQNMIEGGTRGQE